VLFLIANGVGNEEQHDAPDQTEGPPSEFAALYAILVDQRVGISKKQAWHPQNAPHAFVR